MGVVRMPTMLRLEKERKGKEEAQKHLTPQKEEALKMVPRNKCLLKKGEKQKQRETERKAKRNSCKGKKQFSKTTWKLEKQL